MGVDLDAAAVWCNVGGTWRGWEWVVKKEWVPDLCINLNSSNK